MYIRDGHSVLAEFFCKLRFEPAIFLFLSLESVFLFSSESMKTALYEISKHKQDILGIFSLSEGQFSFTLKLLNATVRFAGTEEYRRFLSRAIRTSPDPDDIDFFALALKLGCPLWTEEKRLKKQPKVKVFSTGELLEELGLK